MIQISKWHPFHKCLSHSRVSPYFQELLVYMGQHSCYQQASEVVATLLGVRANAMQIQRLTTDYGAQVGPLLEQTTAAEAISKDQVIYAQLDGSMLLTREQGWQGLPRKRSS